MKCPHCKISFHEKMEERFIGTDTNYQWYVKHTNCASCKKNVIFLSYGNLNSMHYSEKGSYLVYPKASAVTQAPNEVPKHIAEDYNEAGLILNDSPKASAALSRRCLQTIIHEHFKIKERNLSIEIDKLMEIVDSGIANEVDAIRTIGNFAAHPIKSNSTGEIVPVEEGEAIWILEVLEQLFDYCYVKPKKAEERRAKMNEKLKECGKPLLKSVKPYVGDK